jgi:hypothetical protein
MKHLLKLLLLVTGFLFATIVLAQNKGAEAKAAYLLAEEQFNAAKFETCISYLDDAIKSLGTANSKILYLKILSQRELAKADTAYIPKLLATIEAFEKAPDVSNFNEEKYLEVVKLKLLIKKEGMVEKEPEDPATANFRNYTIDGFKTGMSIDELKKINPDYFTRASKSTANGIDSYLPPAGVNTIYLTAKKNIVYNVFKMLFMYDGEDASFSKGTAFINNFKSSLGFNFDPVENTTEFGEKGHGSISTTYTWKVGKKTIVLSISKMTVLKKSHSSSGGIIIIDDAIFLGK